MTSRGRYRQARAPSVHMAAVRLVAVSMAALLMSTGTLLSGCASKEPKPVFLKSQLTAGADLNPNRNQRPQPVKVHIYQLKQDEAFLQASFRTLVFTPEEALGPDLLRHVETLIGPSEAQPLDNELEPATSFVGIVAEFTQIERAGWRVIAEIPRKSLGERLNPFSDQRLTIELAGTQVQASFQ